MTIAQSWERACSALGIEWADEALLREQYRMLRKQVPALYCVLLLSSATLAFKVSTSVGWATAYLYPSLAMPLVAVRLVIWLRRRNRPEIQDIAHLRKMLDLTIVITALLAFGLGVWGVVLVGSTQGLDRAFGPIYISLGAITCGYCLSSIPKAAYLTLVLSSAAPSAALMTLGEPLMTIIGANLLLITALVLRLIVTQYRQLARIVHLSQPAILWGEETVPAGPGEAPTGPGFADPASEAGIPGAP